MMLVYWIELEMPELPWQSSKEGSRRLKEVFILEGIYYVRPETPPPDYVLQKSLIGLLFTKANALPI